MDQPIYLEVHGDDAPEGGDGDPRTPARTAAVVAAVVAVAALLGASILVIGDDADRAERSEPTEPPQSVSPQLEPVGETLPGTPHAVARDAAGCYASAPSAEALSVLFDSIGGFEGLEVGIAQGAFDVVTFDPSDPDTLLAAHRAGYMAEGNEDVNQRWTISGQGMTQSTWDPTTPHDFVHYTSDGSITMWVRDGPDDTFTARRAVVLDQGGTPTHVMSTSSAIQADRFAVDGRTVFALTGDPDWYAPRDGGYDALVADDGAVRTHLSSGASFGWIDVPAPGLLVAYPSGPSGTTAVWDTNTLARLEDHPLSGQPYQRVAVAGATSTALAVTLDGELETIDLSNGRTGQRFGRLDVTEVDRPVALSDDGTVAVTVDKSGTVTIWFVASGTPVATFEASSALPRWLPTSRSAARVTSVVAPDASRVALRIPARPEVSVSWRVIDTDVDSWIARTRTASEEQLTTARQPVC
ncbi:MAG: hypothetical protein QNM02_00715 [Acidimicrobiia bacterium]|nr:hypothetical protein [Acidimicrobiia bacterium]